MVKCILLGQNLTYMKNVADFVMVAFLIDTVYNPKVFVIFKLCTLPPFRYGSLENLGFHRPCFLINRSLVPLLMAAEAPPDCRESKPYGHGSIPSHTGL